MSDSLLTKEIGYRKDRGYYGEVKVLEVTGSREDPVVATPRRELNEELKGKSVEVFTVIAKGSETFSEEQLRSFFYGWKFMQFNPHLKFKEMDTNGDGMINQEEWLNAMEKLASNYSDEEITKWLEEANKMLDKNSEVTKYERGSRKVPVGKALKDAEAEIADLKRQLAERAG